MNFHFLHRDYITVYVLLVSNRQDMNRIWTANTSATPFIHLGISVEPDLMYLRESSCMSSKSKCCMGSLGKDQLRYNASNILWYSFLELVFRFILGINGCI